MERILVFFGTLCSGLLFGYSVIPIGLMYINPGPMTTATVTIVMIYATSILITSILFSRFSRNNATLAKLVLASFMVLHCVLVMVIDIGLMFVDLGDESYLPTGIIYVIFYLLPATTSALRCDKPWFPKFQRVVTKVTVLGLFLTQLFLTWGALHYQTEEEAEFLDPQLQFLVPLQYWDFLYRIFMVLYWMTELFALLVPLIFFEINFKDLVKVKCPRRADVDQTPILSSQV